MNIIEAFNKTADYIETTLDDKIKEKEIIRLSSYSLAMFSRIFSLLTGITLNEYIRFRKLTKAAVDLIETDEKVIDIAVKYGYDSPDAFANAFKKFHGVTCRDVRNGEAYKVFSKIQLALSVKGGKSMEVKIQKKSGFIVAGVKWENINSSSCPNVWDKLFSSFTHEQLSSIGNGQSFGICYDVESENKINYMACYDVKNVNKAKEMGFEILEIQEAEYAVLSLEGSVPECIHKGWKYAMEVFMPEQGYMHSGAPDFEVYFDGDMHSSQYRMELWIPIVKSK